MREFRSGYALSTRTLGREHWRTAVMLDAMAGVEQALGNLEEALAGRREAVAVVEQSLGPEHPHTGSLLANLAASLTKAGRYDEAYEVRARALAIKVAVLGEAHPKAIADITALGFLEEQNGNYERARAHYERAVELRQQVSGDLHIDLDRSLLGVARIAILRGQLPEAESIYRTLIDRAVAKHGAGSFYTGAPQGLLCRVLRDMRRVAEAEEQCARAIQALEDEDTSSGRDALADALTARGLLQLDRGRLAAAVGDLERALELRKRTDSIASDEAGTYFALARALWQAGGDRRRAADLAREAQGILRREAPGLRSDIAAIESWLAVHPAPR